jgi:hypothetical protein
VPIFGNPVLDTVMTLPASVHFDHEGKALLRELARRYLPETVWRRPKHGFSVPLRQLFNGVWREVADDVVSRSADIAPFLDTGQVRALWHKARSRHGAWRLGYTFVVLLLWARWTPAERLTTQTGSGLHCIWADKCLIVATSSRQKAGMAGHPGQSFAAGPGPSGTSIPFFGGYQIT